MVTIFRIPGYQINGVMSTITVQYSDNPIILACHMLTLALWGDTGPPPVVQTRPGHMTCSGVTWVAAVLCSVSETVSILSDMSMGRCSQGRAHVSCRGGGGGGGGGG